MLNRRDFMRGVLAAAALVPLANLNAATLARKGRSTTSDAQLLDELERTAFEFFWHEADPHTGLVRDRALAGGGDVRRMASIAATGFGLTALCIGHRRRYRSRPAIEERVQRTLRYLAAELPHVHGFFYHYVDMRDGQRCGTAELSPIDMAILLCGVLTCREYFQDARMRADAERIYHRVDWQWAMNGGETFALEWTPEKGFSRLRWDTYCELMMLYLLAIGSPTHPIAASCWDRVQRPAVEYQNYRFISTPAPLFVHQFSHAWFDFRGKRDGYTDYFANSVIASQAHRRFCHDLSAKFPSYADDMWGITASDSSKGYVAWGGPPLQGPVDGSLVPAAAAGSLPFVYSESMAVLRTLRSRYGKKIWKRYGFVDAFNPLTDWVASDVVGIDQGISLLMAENARTEFVWQVFMRNPEVKAAMQKCGFHALSEPTTLYSMHASAATAS